jgi:hypothetical protein
MEPAVVIAPDVFEDIEAAIREWLAVLRTRIRVLEDMIEWRRGLGDPEI